MASSAGDGRPPIELKFTGEGPRQVRALTFVDVKRAFETLLFCAEFTQLSEALKCFGVPLNVALRGSKSIAGWWMRNPQYQTWRCIIYFIDMAGGARIANEFIPFAEPPSDQSMTYEITFPIFEKLEKWESTGDFTIGGNVIVPASRADIIRRKHPYLNQKKKAAEYYVNIHPFSSWHNLARFLYRAEEERAINVFKAQLPIPKDPTLSLEAMMTEAEIVSLMSLCEYEIDPLDMTPDQFYSIVEQHGTIDDQKRAIFSEFLSKHPYPSWELVVDLLVELERNRFTRSGLAKELKEKYLTTGGSVFKPEPVTIHTDISASSASPHTSPLPAALSSARPTINVSPASVVKAGVKRKLPSSDMSIHPEKGDLSTVDEEMLLASSKRRKDNDDISHASSASPHTSPLPAALSGARPTISQLYKLEGRGGRTVRVIETAAPSWRRLALALNFSSAAADAIEIGSFYQPVRACECTLSRWLTEAPTGQPVCWASLLQALRHADLTTLASDLELVLMEGIE